MGVVYLTIQTMKQSNLPPELFKTVYFTPGAVLDGGCYSNHGFATVTESLKNHSKSQKNYKMKNAILLDST
jgi:hypothetical protein